MEKRILTTVLLVCALAVAFAAEEKDYMNIKALGDLLPAELDSEFYSGYLAVPGSKRKLHYVLVLSQIDYKGDPLVLLLPPKPGCSAMEQLLTEQSPIIVDQDEGKAELSQHSWNRKVNLFYLDSLTYSGYSIADNENDFAKNDKEQVADIMAVLPVFFEKFPELRDNDLYIAGRNYAGMLGPLLANEINEFNRGMVKEEDMYNLQGLILGNPFTSSTFDRRQSKLEALVGKGFITPELYDEYKIVCEFDERSEACRAVYDYLWALVAQVNHFNIYERCEMKDNKCVQFNYTAFERFFSKPALRTQLHVDDLAQWKMCNPRVESAYKQNVEGALEAYMSIIPSRRIKISIYSGESDLTVPTYGTMNWIRYLSQQIRMSIEEPQRTWYIHGDRENESQAAGTITKYYGGFEFVTIHGAGHFAALNRGAAVFKMMSSLVYENRL